MVKILHMIYVLSKSDGISSFLMNYYRNVDHSKVQFDVICFKYLDPELKAEIESYGGHCFQFTAPGFDFKYIKEVNKFFGVHQGEYKALHCHALFASAFYAPIAKRYGIHHVIVHSHSVGYGKGLIRQIRNFFIVKLSVINANHYFACSIPAADFMFGKQRVKNGQVKIIYNAIDLEKFAYNEVIAKKVRQELKLENAFVVGHVGSFYPPKNHAFLVDVFAELKKIKENAVLILIGDKGMANGSTLSEVRQRIQELGLQDSVQFLGARSDVADLMMGMDCFIFPSFVEGLGLVLIEGQASGLPILASANIPKLAKCTESLFFQSLETSAKVWADKMIAQCDAVKNRTVQSSDFSNFDIKSQSKILEDYYLNLD